MATLRTPEKLRELQRALYLRAKKEPSFRAYALYDKVYRQDVLAHAYALVKANGGAPGPDGETIEDIETRGSEALQEGLHDELKTKRYRPGPVRRVYIPKLGSGERPLGIPNVRDRVVQMAAKLVLEPLFEAGFDKDSFGFRPKRSAHQALDAIRDALEQGMCWIIDADVEAYFDTIPHDRLMKAVAERVVDSSMLALVKAFLEAPIVDERDGGRPKKNAQGTPQGGVVSPLLANIYLNLLDRNFRRRVEGGSFPRASHSIRRRPRGADAQASGPRARMDWTRHAAARASAPPGEDAGRGRQEGAFHFPGAHALLETRAPLPRHREEGATAHPRRDAVENPQDGAQLGAIGPCAEPLHPRGPAVLSGLRKASGSRRRGKKGGGPLGSQAFHGAAGPRARGPRPEAS